MLCQLGDFIFESDGVNLASVKRSMTFDYEETKRINGFQAWQATGQFSQTLTLGGALVAYANDALDGIEALAKKKEPVTLAYEDGTALSVVITAIESDQSMFLKNGAWLKQDFQVSLGVVYGSL